MKRRFELLEGTKAKFWEVEVDGGTMTVRFGRVGTDGRTQIKELGAGAGAAAERLVVEKAKKGCIEVGGTKAPAKPAKSTATPSSSPAASSDAKIEAVVREVGKLLTGYAPTKSAKVRGAASFAELEALVAIPAPLRAPSRLPLLAKSGLFRLGSVRCLRRWDARFLSPRWRPRPTARRRQNSLRIVPQELRWPPRMHELTEHHIWRVNGPTHNTGVEWLYETLRVAHDLLWRAVPC